MQVCTEHQPKNVKNATFLFRAENTAIPAESGVASAIQDSWKLTVYCELPLLVFVLVCVLVCLSVCVIEAGVRQTWTCLELSLSSLISFLDPPIVSLRLGLELGSDALDEGQFVIIIIILCFGVIFIIIIIRSRRLPRVQD